MRKPSFELSRMTDGINRFDRQAGANQCVDGIDVYEDDGDLRRRDAFRAISCSNPFVFQRAEFFMEYDDGSSTFYWEDVIGEVVAPFGGSSATLRLHALRKFDGFLVDVGFSFLSFSQDGNKRLVIRYWNGSSYVSLPRVVDTTVRREASGANRYSIPLSNPGQVSWHRDDVADWATQTVDTQTVYSIEINVEEPTTGSEPSEQGSISLSNVTINNILKPFTLEPINGIATADFRSGGSFILIGSDRRTPLGVEHGANMGLIQNDRRNVRSVDLTVDEGAGVYDQVTFPGIYEATEPDAWPGGGGWVDSGSGDGVVGTSQRFTKTQLDPDASNYNEWRDGQFSGGVLAASLTTVSSISFDGTRQFAEFRITVPITIGAELRDGEWYGLILRVTDAGSSSLSVGDEAEIAVMEAFNPTLVFVRAAPFTVAPTSDTVFELRRKHHILQNETTYDEQEVAPTENDQYDVYATILNTFSPDKLELSDVAGGVIIPNEFQEFAIKSRLQWSVHSGEEWDFVHDPTTGNMLMLNGGNVFSFDGERLRSLSAVSDANNARVQEWIGGLPDQIREQLQARTLAGSKLRSAPPRGKFIIDYFGRTVIANLDSSPYQIAYSAPAPDNDIWPLLYTTSIRGDGENDEITGIKVVNRNLCVFTPTAIYMAPMADDTGVLYFQLISTAVGFLSNRGVANIGTGSLIGPTADGIYALSDATPTPILDRWDRLIEGGVNERRMNGAVGAVSLHRNEYYLAVPSRGSTQNDRLIVYNYATNKIWLWTAPFGGITAISRRLSRYGEEEMLFGTYDGHLCVMVKADTDDGDTITGRAKTPKMQPVGSAQLKPVSVRVVAEEIVQLTVRTFLDNRPSHQSVDEAFAMDGSLYGTDLFGTGKFAGQPLVGRTMPLRHGTNCMAIQAEVEGTGQWRLRSIEVMTGKDVFHPKE